MNILVTGGTGYIGSHTLIELLAAGHTPIVVDNLANSSEESLRRVQTITQSTVPFYKLDIRDKSNLANVFEKHSIDAVIHFAGLKAVGESVAKPLEYYDTNIGTTLALLETMEKYGTKTLIFSSSATVYGDADTMPITEDSQTGVGITNPYGQTKYMIEQILRDYSVANPDSNITILCYFNPVGAHPSGLIGEDPSGTPNNLLPYVTQVAIGRREFVSVYGDDYDTVDGTGVRDYIHVVDLAKGHVAALAHAKQGVSTYNLGTGKGTSVLELIHSLEKAVGKEIPYKVVDRRDGDVATNYASSEKAANELNWHAEKTIDEATADSWRWQSMNPQGF